MIKKITIVLLLVFFAQITFAQAPNIQWQKTYGGSHYDAATSVLQTVDGGYIVAGFSESNDGDVTGNHGSEDYWIVKIDNNGAIQWQKSLGGNSQDFVSDIKQTSDGGYVVVGSSSSTDVNTTLGSWDCWIVKLSSSGDIQWKKAYGGSGMDMAFAIQQTSDGGYIMAGSSPSNDGDATENHGRTDAWIIKLNGNGAIQWQKSFGGSGDESATAIQQTADGGYVFAGFTTSNDGDVTDNHGGLKNWWFVKLNSNGVIQWQKPIRGDRANEAKSIQKTSDGGYIVAGYSQSYNGNFGGYLEYNYMIVKLDSSGVIQWQKSLGGSKDDQANAIQQTSDGCYIVAGYSFSNNGNPSGNHGQSDFWIVKLDNNGGIQWQKSLGGSGYDSASSIQQTSDGGYIIAGLSSSNDGDVTGNHRSHFNYWVVKLNPENLSTLESANKNNILIENPVKTQLNIKSKETIISIQLYNMEGKLIKTSNSDNMPVANLEKGIYVLKIQLKNGDIVSKKIIKE